jgi:hypothetical protein
LEQRGWVSRFQASKGASLPPIGREARRAATDPSGGLLAVPEATGFLLCFVPLRFHLPLCIRYVCPINRAGRGGTVNNSEAAMQANARCVHQGQCTADRLRCCAVRRYALPDKLRDAKVTTTRPDTGIVLKDWDRTELPQLNLEARPITPLPVGSSLVSRSLRMFADATPPGREPASRKQR